MSTGHIRPKIRKAAVSSPRPLPPQEQAVEDVRVKMENWMGINADEARKPSASETMFPSTIEIPAPSVDAKNSNDAKEKDTSVASDNGTQAQSNEHNEKPQALKSILKKPKYSKPTEDQPATEQPQPHPKSKKSVFKQDCVRERDPTTTQSKQIQFDPKQAASAAMAVEGYQPMMDHNKRIKTEEQKKKEENDDADGEPIVFNSLADMMQMVGNLPAQDLENNPQVVEAELAFSCMSPEDYKTGLILQGMEQQEKENEAKEDKTPEWKKTLPKSPVNPDGDYTGNNPISDEGAAYEDDGNEIDDVFFDLMGGGEESEEEPVVVSPPRVFRVLWECLSPLITHESCAFLKRVKREQELSSGGNTYLITSTPLSELEGSRCNGFMAMLRMYMTRALKELDQPAEVRRTAEQRLQGLLCTFNFSRPAAKLETKQWKALTCVLLEMVLFLNRHADEDGSTPSLPASAAAAGMTLDEYRYLVNSTIQTFDIPDPVI